METVMYNSSPDQPIYQTIRRNYRKNDHLAPPNFHGGLLQAPSPYLSHLLPPLAPANRKTNRNRSRDQSRTPKRSKLSNNSPKKEAPKHKYLKSRNMTAILPSESLIIESINSRLRPEPKNLPNNVSSVLGFSSATSAIINNTTELDRFSGSVVLTPSPPPSSLPLPSFSTREKLSCNAETAGIDARATENLRRILHIL